MLNVGLLMKLAKGDLDPDLIAEALEQMGLALEVKFPVNGQVPMLYANFEERCAREGAVAMRIEVRTKSGESFYGLLVQSPAPPIAAGRDRAALPAGALEPAEVSA